MFFEGLLNDFGIDREGLDNNIRAWQNSKTESNGRVLHFSSEPKSQNLFRRLNQSQNGTIALVNMRSDLLRFVRNNPALKDLDRDFSHLFVSWFNRGFLQLQCIDWETPAAILEKIIAYEAVHEIASWQELRQRVGAPDRRLYGCFLFDI